MVKNHLQYKKKISHVDLDLHQKWKQFGLATNSTCPLGFIKSGHNFLSHHVIYSFWRYLSMVKDRFINYCIRIWIRSSPKSHTLIPITHPTCPPILSKFVYNLLRYPAHKQTNKSGGKHNHRPPLVAEVIIVTTT